METSSLRIFLSVVETGSVSGAAKQLNYVQSNVTARIRQLEEELGVALFIRKSRGMSLTSEGRVLKEYAEKILYLVRQASKAVNESLDLGGELIVGSMETAAAIYLPIILSKFHKENANVNLSLLTGTSEEIILKVLEHKVDCAFVGGKVNHPDIMQYKVIEEELVLFNKKPFSSIEESKNITLLVFREGCAYRAHLKHWLSYYGIRQYKIMEFGALDTILGCVEAGMGLTILPRAVAERPQYAHFKVQNLPKEISYINTSFIYHKDTALTNAMKSFLALVEKTNFF
ncbi:LysR family transcriptional regulator [Desulfotalea psychrophila]|uniref:Probable transcriptional regulator n=1 Tax=Desulfotalea psychrophila (strain LSv54 / DSM 12343) TaxID=177439 RepID=Q6ARK3_DESPS|nr:LysR family transcriptional regulator [Desulfotalea psychrophila]CAG35022.1 probable transcriptional regulator [Desulfotalea psychrophila LSv54]